MPPPPERSDQLTRRGFLGRAGALAGGLVLGRATAEAGGGGQPPDRPLPRRTLGKTGVQVPIVGLGTACAGQSEAVTLTEAVALFRTALDEGLDYFDSARGYEKAEEALGQALAGRRDQVFVTTKAHAEDVAGAQASFEDSLRRLGTDHVDLLYLHGVGTLNVDRILAPGGSLEYLLRQKELGRARYIGATAHSNPSHLLRLVESEQLDVIMMAMNYVERHVYGFEERVLPAARERNLGVLAMKVFGGLKGNDFRRYYDPNPGPQLEAARLHTAFRYAASLDGVSAAVLGMHTVAQLRENLAWARRFQPLSADEMAALREPGQRLAQEWGQRYGPAG